MSTNTIPIITAADELYIPHLAAMLHSLFSCTSGKLIDIYYLHRPRVSTDSIAKLRTLCHKSGAGFHEIEVDPVLLEEVPVTESYIEEAWYRLFLTSLLPDLNRALWLDADVLVLESISKLWDMDIGGAPLAAVPNALSEEMSELPKKLGMQERVEDYFNTGVMILDLRKMREIGAEDEMRKALSENCQHVVHADQDVFNPVFQENYFRLPLCWNVISGTYFVLRETLRVHGYANYKKAIHKPCIVHFTRLKPWRHDSYHPYRGAYLKHRLAAGWGAPDFDDANWKSSLVRHTPMIIRTIVGKLWRRQFSEAFAVIKARFHFNF